MSAVVAGEPAWLDGWSGPELHDIPLEAFGKLTAISRIGGQGRVHRPATAPQWLGPDDVVVKLYRRPPPAEAADVLAEMVAWERSISFLQRARLRRLAAWPLALVTARGLPVGIAMRDVSGRFATPFVMPSGRREPVLLALEHLLGEDAYLQARGLDVRLDTATRALVAERISGALAFLHQHAIVASDIAPSNVLVAFGAAGAEVCVIDCDSMVFRGRQALAAVETGDWEIPAEFAELPNTRATDAYKLGLVVLRLFVRSHDERALAPSLKYVPVELRDLLYRALSGEAANRPPAGEWQRALHGLLGRRDLNERYPGPLPPAAPPRAASAPPPRLDAPAAHASRPPARARGSRGLGQLVVALWVAALAVLLIVLVSRLIAAASPPATTVPNYPFGRNPQVFRYYNPAQGPGQGFAPGGQRIIGLPSRAPAAGATVR